MRAALAALAPARAASHRSPPLTTGILGALYYYKQPMKQHAENRQAAGEPLVRPDQVAPNAGRGETATATAPQK